MLLFLLALGGAIASCRIARRIKDESLKIIILVFELMCATASLILAPWFLKLIAVLLLLTIPTCMTGRENPPIVCPKCCIARGRCRTFQAHCLGWTRVSMPTYPLHEASAHSEKG